MAKKAALPVLELSFFTWLIPSFRSSATAFNAKTSFSPLGVRSMPFFGQNFSSPWTVSQVCDNFSLFHRELLVISNLGKKWVVFGFPLDFSCEFPRLGKWYQTHVWDKNNPAITLTWGFSVPVISHIWGSYVPMTSQTWGFLAPMITLTWDFYVPMISLTWGL